MQMLVLPSSGGFASVAPMLFTSQLTLAIPDTHHIRRENPKEKKGKLLKKVNYATSGEFIPLEKG